MRIDPFDGELVAFLPISTEDYLDLIDWTARLTRPDKQGKVAGTEPPILRNSDSPIRNGASRCWVPKPATGAPSAARNP